MKLKQCQFRVADVATEAEMVSVFDEVKTIDTLLKQGCLQKKSLMKAKDFQNLMETHSHRSLISYVNTHLTLVPTAHLIQFACRRKNSTLSAVFLFPYLSPVNTTLSLSRKCMVSYQKKKTHHP